MNVSKEDGIPEGFKLADERTQSEYTALQTHASLVAELKRRMSEFSLSIEHSTEIGTKLQKALTEKGFNRLADGRFIMKALGLLLSLALLLPLGGCGFFHDAEKGAVSAAEGKGGDTSSPGAAVGTVLTTGALILAGVLLPGIPVAAIVKNLVTSLDSSVPAASHEAAIVGLAQSVPVAVHQALIDTHAATVQQLGASVPAASVVPILAAQKPQAES